MNPRAIVLSFAFACASGISASGEAVLVPREVFVGDRAQLTFSVSSLELPKGEVYEVPVSEIASSEDATLESIVATSDLQGTTVSIFFIPWRTGVVKLPSFTVEKVRIVPPEIRISSIVDKTGRSSLEPARPPLLVPGTTWLAYGYIAAGVLSLFAAGVAIARVLAWLAANPRDRKSSRYAKRRTRALSKSLRHLEKQSRSMGVDEWYAALARALRCYLGALCALDGSAFASHTRFEVLEECGRIGISDTEIGEEGLGGILARIDAIRFSGEGSSEGVEGRLRDAESVRTIAARLEKAVLA